MTDSSRARCNPTLMAQQLRDGSLSLTDAIYSDQVPAHVLHHFACDCAERSLMNIRALKGKSWRKRFIRVLQRQKEAEFLLWGALRTKRQWIEGEIDEQELEEVTFRLKATINKHGWNVRGDAAVATSCAMMKESRDAAWCTAWYAVGVTVWFGTDQDERVWQRCHLATLLDELAHKQHQLLALLSLHKDQVDGTLTTQKELLEGWLFSDFR